MQGVLKERFELRLHEGSHPMAVYELVQDKGGARETRQPELNDLFGPA